MALMDRAIAQGLELLSASPAWVKVIAFFLAWASLWLPVVIPLAIFLRWHPPKPITAQQKLPILASLYLIAPLIVWGASLLQKVSLSDIGVKMQNLTAIPISLSFGLGLGVLSLSLVFAIQGVLGWINWQKENRGRLLPIVLPVLLLGLWVSATEELIFRGFLQNELEQDYSRWVAAAIASFIFAISHLLWDLKETIPQLPGLWLMGMVLTLARWADGGSLALAWGLHAGWIWGLSCIDTAELITYTGKASKSITGIAGKPLAGVAGIACLLLTAIALELFFIGLPQF